MSITTAPPGLVFVTPEWGRLPVTNMFDVDREQTTDPELACTVVAMLPNGKWISAACEPGEVQRTGLS